MIDKTQLARQIISEINFKLDSTNNDTVVLTPSNLGFSREELAYLEPILEELEIYGLLTREQVSLAKDVVVVTTNRDEVSNWLQPKRPDYIPQNPIIRYKLVVLDTSNNTIFFRDFNKPIPIAPNNKPMIFLRLLLDNPERLVTYSEIYKYCRDEELSQDEIIADPTTKESIKELKKELGDYLIRQGMSIELASELKTFINAHKNQGYVLRIL